MLYHIYEAQRSLTEPFADFAKAASKLFSNNTFPFAETAFASRISAAYDLFYRLGKDYEKPAFDIPSVSVNGVDVAIQERVEIDKPFCELRRFKRYSDNLETLEELLKQPVVLIVAPLSGHYATLLRETVRTMLTGHRVYITDWKNARNVPLSDGEFHLDDYVNYVQEFIRYVQGKYGNCHIMSVCQPTVPVLAAISLMASRGEKTPLSMTMMGGPIDASKSPTSVNALAQSKSFAWFENNVIYRVPHGFAGEGRRVYPGFLQYAGFVAMNPDRHATSHYDYFRNLIKGDESATEHHRKFYDEYNAVLDMDANYYLQTIATVFQNFNLVNGTWEIRSPEGELELVRPQDIKTTALITVEGELDDISGSGQTKAAHTLCSSIPADAREHIEVEGAGHYGIFSGSRWRNQVYPQLRDFYRRFPVESADGLNAQTATRQGIAKQYIFNEDHAAVVIGSGEAVEQTAAPTPTPASKPKRVAAPRKTVAKAVRRKPAAPAPAPEVVASAPVAVVAAETLPSVLSQPIPTAANAELTETPAPAPAAAAEPAAPAAAVPQVEPVAVVESTPVTAPDNVPTAQEPVAETPAATASVEASTTTSPTEPAAPAPQQEAQDTPAAPGAAAA